MDRDGFTKDEVLEFTGVAMGDFKYWRSELGPIRHKRGHSARYRDADLLALMIVNEMIHEGGETIGFISRFADSLFEACELDNWPTYEMGGALFFDLAQKRVSVIADPDSFPKDRSRTGYWAEPRKYVEALRADLIINRWFGPSFNFKIPSCDDLFAAFYRRWTAEMDREVALRKPNWNSRT